MLIRELHQEQYFCRECGEEYKSLYSDTIKEDQKYQHGICQECEEKKHKELNNA